jgi:hypothetical protein
MPQQEWQAAINRVKNPQLTPRTTLAAEEKSARLPAVPIEAAAEQLERFLGSPEGKVGLDLLRAKKSWIGISEERTGGGMAVVDFLDENGLRQSIEPSGESWLYVEESKRPQPVIKPVSALEVIKNAVAIDSIQPFEVLNRIRAGLDRLASST